MSQEPTNQVDDETALDAELAESIERIKAGKVLEETPQNKTAEAVTKEDTSVPPEKTETGGEGPGDSQPPAVIGDANYRIPNKGKFESDDAYERRIELFDLVKKRKDASTPEAKAQLSEQISRTKGELKILGGTERITHPQSETPLPEVVVTDPLLKADRERLKELGGATVEDIQEVIRQERATQEVKSDLAKFIGEKTELHDSDVREVFFDFVDTNYVWQGKSGKELFATLSMAYENMFRPSESIQERVLKGAGVQEQVNAMQFPGATGAEVQYSPEMKKSIDELKSAGMSEEKAVELLSE